MKKAKYINIRKLIDQEEFKNFEIFTPRKKVAIKKLVLDDTTSNFEKYIIKNHHAYQAINSNGRVVLPHGNKPTVAVLEEGKIFTTGAYSKSTRTFAVTKRSKFISFDGYPNKLSPPKLTSRKIEHRVRCNDIFNTISTGFGGGFQSSLNCIAHGNKLRVPTPLECERMMSWPDDWTKYGRNSKGEVYELTDADRYHLCGNGIVSKVPKMITSHIKENVKVFSTFSGADGSCLALPKNFKTVAFCEFDVIPGDILRYHYPDVPNYGDITKIDITKVPDFDLLFISAPCQAFSKAGKRGGFEDTRGTLFFEAAKIMKERRPKYVMFENVKDLINHDGGKTLEVILRVFVELGYRGKIDVLDSSEFGVPQARERLFILAERIDDKPRP